jgi:uncharacterized membrane protein
MTKAQNYWRRLTATLWFIPSVLTLGGAVLGLLLVSFDYYFDTRIDSFSKFWEVQPSGARDMLAVVAGSMMTVAGTVFSITIVALTLASTQFSPRILRNFMRDAGNQVVLGVFVGIFAYCIVVLRTIREGGNESTNFVPTIAVALGVILGLVGVGFLIYYIHHIGTSIQATSIISQIADETVSEIERNFLLEYDSKQADAQVIIGLSTMNWHKIPSAETGYVQNADTSALIELADKYDLIVQMRRRVGEFTIKELPLLQISTKNADFKIDKSLIAEFNEAYDIGDFRTVQGDIAFGIRQIVDISLKALSPAINDTTTGISCIDYLTAIMVCLAKRPSPPPLQFVSDKLRLVNNPQRFEDYFDLAINQLRQNSAGNVAIILRLLNLVEVLGKMNQKFNNEDERKERHELFETQARLLFEQAERTISADSDLQSIIRRFNHVKETLEGLR